MPDRPAPDATPTSSAGPAEPFTRAEFVARLDACARELYRNSWDQWAWVVAGLAAFLGGVPYVGIRLALSAAGSLLLVCVAAALLSAALLGAWHRRVYCHLDRFGLRCPGCGASLSGSAAESVLVTKRCGECGRRVLAAGA